MAEFTTTTSVSFAALETLSFNLLGELFNVVLTDVLTFMDEALRQGRDRERFVPKDWRPREIESLFGTIRFKRRTYLDRETGRYVALLDEALGLKSRERVSEGLNELAVAQAIEGPSYRSGRDNLKRFYGHQVLSHETIRQRVLKVGRRIAEDERRRLEQPNGDRRVKVLLLEADGFYVARQRTKERRREVRLMTAHEGWRRRHPASEEYELVRRTHFTTDGAKEDFWEGASRALYSRYDLEDTVIVINGDRAPWIRKGTEYFPKAIYQFDRFHLIRELRQTLRGFPKEQAQAIQAVRANQPDEVLRVLRAVALRPQGEEAVGDLLSDLETNPEAMVDYRARLAAMGLDVTGFRGLGAAESNVNRFSKRLRHRGQSWGTGLGAMVSALCRKLEGRLLNFATDLSEIRTAIDETRLAEGAGRVTAEVANAAMVSLKGHMPALESGRNASHGLSHFFRKINQTLPAGLS